MLKQLFVGLSIVSMCTLECMESSDMQIQKVPEQAICHFARLSKDVSNYIAYLAFEYESEAEFIERTKVLPEVSIDYYTHLKSPFRMGMGSRGCKAAWCPDKTKLIFADLVNGGLTYKNIKPMLTIINNKKQVLHQENLSKNSINLVAISSCGHVYANIQKRIDCTPRSTEEMRYEYVLIVKNVKTNNVQEFSIPYYRDTTHSISFNKQGNQIVLYGSVYIVLNQSHNHRKYHLIFPIDQCTECAKAKPKTLDEYFLQHQICKKL